MPRRSVKLEKIPGALQHGFSLLELLISLVILSAVLAVVVGGAVQMQKSTSSQADKADLTQGSRQFIDQVVLDLHQTGFPNYRLFTIAGSPPCAQVATAACGLINITSSSLQFEGDVDGSGQVSEEFVQVSAAPCPCTISRGTVPKAAYMGGTMPTYYMQLDNVMTPTPFSVYDYSGTQIQLPCTLAAGCSDASSTAIANIKDVGIIVEIQSVTRDQSNNSFATVTMAANAKINN